MIIKSKSKNIDLKIQNIEFLNRPNIPLTKISKELKDKLSCHENLGLIKKANKSIDPPDSLKFPEDFDIKKDMETHPDNLYVKALAIIADEPNDNGDYFSKEELKKSFHTFVGCPLFVNHKNDDVEEARGTILFSEWSEEDNGIMIIGRVDAKAYPKLARGISEGYISGVSMGCQVGYSECSICNNQAAKEEEYCVHIKEHKTRKFNGKDVYEKNYGLKFIELSFVVDPACSTCYIQEIYDIDDLKEKVAKIQEFASSFKKVASKTAGKEEINKLNEAENLIQEVAKIMLDQKAQLELSYVTDLVEALSKLQETKDELIDMGYESLPSTPVSNKNITDNNFVPENTEENIEEQKGQNLEQSNTNYENVGVSPAGEVGTVTMPGAMASNFRKNMIKKARKKILSENFKNKLIKKWNKER